MKKETYKNSYGEYAAWTEDEVQLVIELVDITQLMHTVAQQRRKLALEAAAIRKSIYDIKAKLAETGRTDNAIRVRMQEFQHE